jgi:hypothetical protein
MNISESDALYLNQLLLEEHSREPLSVGHTDYYWAVECTHQTPKEDCASKDWHITFSSPKLTHLRLTVVLTHVLPTDLGSVGTYCWLAVEVEDNGAWVQAFSGRETKEIKLSNLRNTVDQALKDLIGEGKRLVREQAKTPKDPDYWQSLDKKI